MLRHSEIPIFSGKPKILLTLLFAVIVQFSFGQNEWAPINAVWYYGLKESPAVSVAEGYLKFEVEKDTLVLGKICKKIKKTLVRSNGSIFDKGYELMYSDSNKVYHLLNNHFYTLYDFNATQGQSWITRIPYEMYGWLLTSDSLRIIKVDSVKTLVIDTDTFKLSYTSTYKLDTTYIDDWFFEKPIIEKIGGMSFMFLFYSLCEADVPYLRCYKDSVIQYISDTNMLCDQLISYINKANSDTNITVNIFPNPSKENINIKIIDYNFNENYSIIIINSKGECVYELKKIRPFENIIINTNNLGNGMYLFHCYNYKKNFYFTKKIIIN